MLFDNFVCPKLLYKNSDYPMTKHLFFLSLLWIAVCTTLSAQSEKRWVVVIDAGHGGKDPGAIGKSSKEKDITLKLAQQTGKLISDNIPNVRIIYTRSTDVFVELYQRAKIANDAKADLFISIHCNANKSKTPRGTEVYVMGASKTDDNLEVAMKENSSALLEEGHEEKYDGINPNSSEAYIAFSLYQNMYLDRSLQFSQNVIKNMNSYVKLPDRGIRQAPFFVLYRTTMPSVLIEAGFISNLADEAMLNSVSGQQKISYSIYKAFLDYKNQIDKSKVDAINPVFDKEPEPQQSNPDTVKNNPGEIVFRVQFATFDNKIPEGDKKLRGLTDIYYSKAGGKYKHFCGKFTGFDEAAQYQAEVRRKGFADAFVVAFEGDDIIPVLEAKKKLRER